MLVNITSVMKKSFLFAAVAVLALGACTKVDSYTEVAPEALTFGAYSPRVQTKAGATIDMNLKNLATEGFGVFATYSGTADFTAASDDFMYNQQVTSADEGATWTYAPIKYWPNPTDGSAANNQKLSFFAYAPYCEPGTAETVGITGFEIDATTKHDIVKYAFKSNVPNVDLMWGYKKDWNGTSTVDAERVNLNLTRTTEKVGFKFRHTLAKLAGSQEGDPGTDGSNANGFVILAAPTLDPTNGFGTATGTKVTVTKITVKSADTDLNGDPISYAADDETQEATLDLYTGKLTLPTTVKNMKFSQTIAANPNTANGENELADDLKEVANPANFGAVNKGVTKVPVNVYKNEVNPIILIPGTAPCVEVEITYVVRTYDAKLDQNGDKHFSEVPQTVYKKIQFPTIEENRKYNLRAILGLMDVKFEASVEDWTLGFNDANGNGVQDPGEDTYENNVYLPQNL